MKQKIAILVLALGFFGWLFYSSQREGRVVCEGCITYGGHTSCAKAAAATKEDSLRQLTTIACTELAGGMTDSIMCNQSEPDKTNCTGAEDAEAPAGRY